MATTMYFESEVKDQERENSFFIEFGRSSFYSGCKLENGKLGEDSIYLEVDGKLVIMDLDTARKFVNAAADVGRYFGILEE